MENPKLHSTPAIKVAVEGARELIKLDKKLATIQS
jgi:hypothetical protein